MSLEPFIVPTPDEWAKDLQISNWVFHLQLLLDNLTREDGVVDSGDATAAVVLTQQEKLDLIGITQNVNLDTLESGFNSLVDGTPLYSPSNDVTLRILDANAAAGAISASPTQAEVENIRDAVLKLADFASTMARDLGVKGVFGT